MNILPKPRPLTAFRDILDRDGPMALATDMIARIRATQNSNALTQFDAETLRATMTTAKRCDGPLAGIPFAVKDNIDTRPYATTGGSPALAAYRPSMDAPPVALLRSKGAVPALKTNLHEFAFGVTSNNATYGPVRNPFDPKRVAGGSSGGSGAAVALGLVPYALGTDTGGSVRIPAAFCGICGFRPSTGRYPDGGVLTISPTRDTVGVMAVTVADTAEVDAAITAAPPLQNLTGRALRIGIATNAHAGMSRAVDNALAAVFERLAGAGHILIPVDSAAIDAEANQIAHPIAFNEAMASWDSIARRLAGKDYASFVAQTASPDVKAIFEMLPSLTRDTKDIYAHVMTSARPALQASYTTLLDSDDLDVIVSSSVPVQPPLIGEDDSFVSDGISYPTFDTIVLHATRATIVGAPSLSIPAGLDADGLPVGLMIDGRRGADRFVLAAGALIEAALSASKEAKEFAT